MLHETHPWKKKNALQLNTRKKKDKKVLPDLKCNNNNNNKTLVEVEGKPLKAREALKAHTTHGSAPTSRCSSARRRRSCAATTILAVPHFPSTHCRFDERQSYFDHLPLLRRRRGSSIDGCCCEHCLHRRTAKSSLSEGGSAEKAYTRREAHSTIG